MALLNNLIKTNRILSLSEIAKLENATKSQIAFLDNKISYEMKVHKIGIEREISASFQETNHQLVNINLTVEKFNTIQPEKLKQDVELQINEMKDKFKTALEFWKCQHANTNFIERNNVLGKYIVELKEKLTTLQIENQHLKLINSEYEVKNQAFSENVASLGNKLQQQNKVVETQTREKLIFTRENELNEFKISNLIKRIEDKEKQTTVSTTTELLQQVAEFVSQSKFQEFENQTMSKLDKLNGFCRTEINKTSADLESLKKQINIRLIKDDSTISSVHEEWSNLNITMMEMKNKFDAALDAAKCKIEKIQFVKLKLKMKHWKKKLQL
jgi:hypothetical protein